VASEAFERLRKERDDLEAMAAAAEPFTGKDTEAPHGRTRAGQPKTSAPKRPTRRRVTDKETKDYEEQILGLFQLPAGALAVAGMQNPVYAADARTVTIYAPGIATALNDLAKERPEVAAVLDKVLAVGPYGIVLAAITPMVLQMLTNHGKIPPGTAGTVPPQELIADLLVEPPSPNGQGESVTPGTE
jgi:hypothetical protein